MAAETDTGPRQRASGGNVFTRKIGPMPMWAWLAIVGTVIIGYAYWKNRQNSSSTASQSSTADASQVPQFVNQTYTTVQPPSAPTTTTPEPDEDETGTPAAHGPPGVSRVHRSPQVKHQINKIHKEHSDYEADKTEKKAPPKKKPGLRGGPVHRPTPTRKKR